MVFFLRWKKGCLQRDLANTSEATKGDALIGFKQPFPGSVARTVHEKLVDTLSVRDFGAIGDGDSHPLSERFPTLAEARTVYRHARSLDDEIDGLAIKCADANGSVLFHSGTYLINDIILKNPPTFHGKVTFLVEDGASRGLTFQGDSWCDQEVQGGFFIDGRSNKTACELLTIQGRNWVIPKVHIYGKGRGKGDIGLRLTNYAPGNVPCTHNHIGFIMIKGVTDAVKWDCDDRAVVRSGYACNNVIEHAYLLSNTNHWHYNYTVTDVTADDKFKTQYFRNRLHHGYFERSDIGFKFTGNSMGGNVLGVFQDWWAVSFELNTTEFDTILLRPSGTLHSIGYGTLTMSVHDDGGHLRNIVRFQRQGPNQYARFAGTIAEDPGDLIDQLGHQVRISSLSGPWHRGFYLTDGSISPAVKRMALGVNGTDSAWSHAWLGAESNNWAVRIDLSDMGLQLGDSGNELAFFGSTPITKPTVRGSRDGNAALASLLAALTNLGLITDDTVP